MAARKYDLLVLDGQVMTTGRAAVHNCEAVTAYDSRDINPLVEALREIEDGLSRGLRDAPSEARRRQFEGPLRQIRAALVPFDSEEKA